MRRGSSNRISQVLLAFLFTAVLTCGAVAQSTEPVEITYYHRSHQVELEWARIVIERFHAEHPDIRVTLVPSGGGGGIDYFERLMVLQAGGMGPDVFTGYADKAGFMANGMTLDLAPFVERDHDELEVDSFFPGVWETFHSGERIYGIPLTLTNQFVFYNADMFAEYGLPELPTSWDDPDWTWERLLAYSRVLTVQDAEGTYEQLAITTATEAKLPDVAWMFGGDWFTPAAYELGVAERVTLNTPENVRAYSAVQELYQHYAAAGPAKGIGPANGFHQGRVAMDWIGAWRLNSYRDAMRAGSMPFAWRIAPVPLAENRANTRWTNPLYINSQTQHPEAAWEFVKFATSTDSQMLWAEMTSMMPARTSAVESYLASLGELANMPVQDLLEVVSGAIVHSRPSIEELITDVPFEITRITNQLFGPIFNGQADAATALQQAEEVLNGFLRAIGPREPW